MSYFEGDLRTPGPARFAIVVSRWNTPITDALVSGARQSLAANGIAEEAVDVIRVPGVISPIVRVRLVTSARAAGDGL